MTHTTTPTTGTAETGTSSTTSSTPHRDSADFRTSEGLRALLEHLAEHGWRNNPQAKQLLEFAAERFAPLARKHGLDVWEAASAAFDVMRTPAARNAADPWAVVTHAVRITCIYEERAQGLLCSVHQARRAHISAHHDPERFSDREKPLYEYHPAFQLTDPHHREDAEPSEDVDASVQAAVADATRLFVLLGWPEASARAGVDHVTNALARIGSRRGTYEALRRDKHARALLDLPAPAWTCLLRVLLGHPEPAYATTTAGRGILLRLLLGETLADLLGDDALVACIVRAIPGRERVRS
ncbi:hypothetical protein [Pseudoclavibacter albus]|uniref:hypothetical protein n=1 Tax=Pseudoclavibacter albus TaxID=272241 RepID=UPI0008242BEE|nr:hypothetical protein [Pseudoclavibacter alba]